MLKKNDRKCVFTPAMLDQIIFSRCPKQAAATARARMEEPKYWKGQVSIANQLFRRCRKSKYFGPNTWWKGRRRALISGENLGKRKAAKPRPHWHPKSKAARSPTQLRRRRSNLIDCVVLQSFCVILLVHSSYLCNVYMLGLGGSGLLWLSKAA